MQIDQITRFYKEITSNNFKMAREETRKVAIGILVASREIEALSGVPGAKQYSLNADEDTKEYVDDEDTKEAVKGILACVTDETTELGQILKQSLSMAQEDLKSIFEEIIKAKKSTDIKLEARKNQSGNSVLTDGEAMALDTTEMRWLCEYCVFTTEPNDTLTTTVLKNYGLFPFEPQDATHNLDVELALVRNEDALFLVPLIAERTQHTQVLSTIQNIVLAWESNNSDFNEFRKEILVLVINNQHCTKNLKLALYAGFIVRNNDPISQDIFIALIKRELYILENGGTPDLNDHLLCDIIKKVPDTEIESLVTEYPTISANILQTIAKTTKSQDVLVTILLRNYGESPFELKDAIHDKDLELTLLENEQAAFLLPAIAQLTQHTDVLSTIQKIVLAWASDDSDFDNFRKEILALVINNQHCAKNLKLTLYASFIVRNNDPISKDTLGALTKRELDILDNGGKPDLSDHVLCDIIKKVPDVATDLVVARYPKMSTNILQTIAKYTKNTDVLAQVVQHNNADQKTLLATVDNVVVDRTVLELIAKETTDPKLLEKIAVHPAKNKDPEPMLRFIYRPLPNRPLAHQALEKIAVHPAKNKDPEPMLRFMYRPLPNRPLAHQVKAVMEKLNAFNELTVQQQQVVVTQLTPQQRKDAVVANLLSRMGRK